MTSINATIKSAATAGGGSTAGGESELKRQIAASGATPVATDPRSASDPYVRYVMPSLVIKRGGAHGGSLGLTNLSYVCAVLRRPPTILLKFFGGELGCRVLHVKDPNKGGTHDAFAIIGHHEEQRLVSAVYKFNERCVLCHKCRDPVGRVGRAESFGEEAKNLAKKDAALILDLPTAAATGFVSTVPATFAKTLKGLSLGKLKPCLTLDCSGCGHVSFLDPSDKLQAWLSVHLQEEEATALKALRLKEAAIKRKADKAAAVEEEDSITDDLAATANEEDGDDTVAETPDEPPATVTANVEPPSPQPPATPGDSSATPPPPPEDGETKEKKPKKDKKDKKEKKEKKEKEGGSGDDAAEKETIIAVPKEAVTWMVLEMKAKVDPAASVSATPKLKPAPESDSEIKSTVNDVARMHHVEGGKQAKVQLVIRALLTFSTSPRTTADAENTTSDPVPLTQDQLAWVTPWNGSKTLDRALKAEGAMLPQ